VLSQGMNRARPAALEQFRHAIEEESSGPNRP